MIGHIELESRIPRDWHNSIRGDVNSRILKLFANAINMHVSPRAHIVVHAFEESLKPHTMTPRKAVAIESGNGDHMNDQKLVGVKATSPASLRLEIERESVNTVIVVTRGNANLGDGIHAQFEWEAIPGPLIPKDASVYPMSYNDEVKQKQKGWRHMRHVQYQLITKWSR